MNRLVFFALVLTTLISTQTSTAYGKAACGMPAIQGARVIGGINAVRGSWPWQILLQFEGRAMCSGSLISPQWVVTAAHCVYGNEMFPSSFTVVVGEYDRTKVEGSERTYEVENIFMNEYYNKYQHNNDIALIKLKTPVQFNKYVSPVCLPDKAPPVGTTCYITGWGKIHHPGHMYTILQQGKLPVVSNAACNAKNFRNMGVKITDSMICGGDGGKSELSGCHGDSGGPYVCKINGIWELHGAVSHGPRHCDSTWAYTVFARVHHFKKWIDTTMKWNSK